MDTLILRIAEPDGDAFPITLWEVADGNPQGDRPCASASLPLELPGGDAMAPERLRQDLLGEPGPSRRFSEIGDHLFRTLALGDVGARLAAAAGLRLYLDIRPRVLRLVPWELLRRDDKQMFADAAAPCARIRPGADLSAVAPAEQWPLRILVVVGSAPDDGDVGAEQELLELQVALRPLTGLVDLEILRRPADDQLIETYEYLRPHVFHFIGHGGADEAGDGALWIYDEQAGESRDWNAEAIRTQLAGWTPNLAVINACRTVEPSDQEGVWDVSDAFGDLGVPAVIAMQANISGSAAATFTSGLYRAMANGDCLDEALSEARLRMLRGEGAKRRDFGLPVLMLSRHASGVLPIASGVSADQRRQLERMPRWGELRDFVDRSRERRGVLRRVDPRPGLPTGDDGLAAPPAVVLVVGAAKIGKSALVRTCLWTAALAGRNVAYVDLDAGGRTLNFLDVLRAIRDALIVSPVHGAANARALRGFTQAVNALMDGHAPIGPPPEDVEDRGVQFPDRAAGPEDTVEQLFAAFRAGLAGITAEEPLLIALDQLWRVEASDMRRLCGELIEPVAFGHLDSVRVVLVVDEGRVDTLLSRELAEAHAVRVDAFKREEFRDLALLFLRYRRFTLSEKEKLAFVSVLQVVGDGDPTPAALLHLAGLADNLGLAKDQR
jgi:hypothetical protein